MNRKEWQAHHGFTDDFMEFLCMVMEMFGGKITAVINEKEDNNENL